jgi:hypothetical protein
MSITVEDPWGWRATEGFATEQTLGDAQIVSPFAKFVFALAFKGPEHAFDGWCL